MTGQQILENYAKEIAQNGDDYKKVITRMADGGYSTDFMTWLKVSRKGSEVIVTKIVKTDTLQGQEISETVELTIAL